MASTTAAEPKPAAQGERGWLRSWHTTVLYAAIALGAAIYVGKQYAAHRREMAVWEAQEKLGSLARMMREKPGGRIFKVDTAASAV
jgi:hypothetical protein